MKLNIPPVAQFSINVLLFLFYLMVLKFLATLVFSFFIVLYLGGNIGVLPGDSVFLFKFSAMVIALAFDLILIIKYHEYFYLFNSKK